MTSVISKDHAFPNGSNGADADPIKADPGGMTNEEKEAVAGVLAKDANKGAAVHAFDPDATPEQKASLAGAAKAQLDALPIARRKKEAEAGLALGIDTSSKGGAPAPTVTVKDGDVASRNEGQDPGADGIPGNFPAGAAPAVPTWLQTGWRQVAGLDPASAMDAKKQADAGLLASYLSEQMYGAWYHNAGIILFAVLSTRFITSINLGFAWVLIILAFCAAYYSLSIVRTRNRARDDIQRELVKTRLVTETESADWLNGFLDRFWLIYEPVLSQTIVASVDSALAASTPGFVESIRMTTFTLGTKAPRIDYVRTFPKTPEDIVTMDWAVSFTPNDLQDITPREAAKRVNPKIALTVRVGKGVVSKGMSILLEDMSFTGRMRIKLKLMTTYPHIKTVEMSFIQKPTFDYVLKPIGGELGFDINNIPALAPFIRDQVHANLGPMMYDPNVFTIDLEALLSGTPLDSAIGVLKVTILGARSIKAVKLGGGAPDPYVTLNLGAKPVIAKTKTIPSTNHPSWHETHFILVNSLADVLNLGMWDYNDRRPDNKLGVVSKELKVLEQDAEQDGVVGKIIYEGKERGELRYDLSFYPVLQPAKLPDGSMEPIPETSTGIVRLTLHQAKDLDISGELGHLNPFARVFLGSSKQPVHKTPILKRTPNPIWESHCEFLVPDKAASVISVDLLDSKGLQRDPTIGALSVKLLDLLELKERGQDWLPLQRSRGGKIRMTAEWKPVAMAGSLSGAHDYIPPIGILRIWIKRATDVKNVEIALGGKSDPYVRVMGRNKILARTEVVSNNLNPEWDQVVYVPIHNLKQHLVMELMDYQNIGRDRPLGYVELRAKDFIQENNEGEDKDAFPFKSLGVSQRNDRIKLDKANSYKGNLMYEVDFKPAMSLRGGVSFEEMENEAVKAAAEEGAGGSKGVPLARTETQTSVFSGSVNGGGSEVLSPGGAGVAPPGAQTANRHGPRPSIGGFSVASVQTANTGHTAGTAGTAATDAAAAAAGGATGATGTGVESKAGGEATEAEDPEKGVEMTKEQLLASKSGVLVFQLISGTLARKGSVEVMLDDGYWPAFTSTRSRSSQQNWDQIGEGFVREIEHSRIWLRINANDDSDKEDTVAEFRCDTKTFLEACMGEPAEFLLTEGGSNKSTLKFAARYVPVDIDLEPRESINNMGVLRVDVLRANSLHAADRSGKSDPNITFTLNGSKVFKSETIKKTLNPEWNESFECMVPSRIGADFDFEINDWDRVGKATHLGKGTFDLSVLVPDEEQEHTIKVLHEKQGEKGTVTIRTLFQPEFIARTRGNKNGGFSAPLRVVGTVGGVPLAAGKLAGKGVLLAGGVVAGGAVKGVGSAAKGVGTVGKGVGAVGGFAGRKIGLIKKKDKSGKEILVSADALDDDDDIDGLEVMTDGGRPSYDAVGALERGPPPTEPGTLTVTILGAREVKAEAGAKLKSHVALKMAGKQHKTDTAKGVEPEWNETFNWNIVPTSNMLHVALHEHQLLGRDPVLGETEIDIWQYIDSINTSAIVPVDFSNEIGTVNLRLDWSSGVPPVSSDKVSRKKSMSSLAGHGHGHGHHNGAGNGDNQSTTAGSPGRLSGLRMSLSRRHVSSADD